MLLTRSPWSSPGARSPRRNGAQGRRWIPLVLGFAAFAPSPALAGKPTTPPAFDISGWQALLDKYCIRLGGKDGPLDTRFDYEQLYVDEKVWTLKRSDALNAVHAQLSTATPSTMTPSQRLAWAIDTYNFLVVERATMHLLVPARGFLRYSSVNQMITYEGPFFDAPVVSVEGRSYSLRQFQRTFAFGDTTSVEQRRTHPADPRIAFAMCPGAMGTAPLMPRAFLAESLDAQLDRAVRTALALPRTVRLEPPAGAMAVADWLNETRADYGAHPEQGQLEFLAKYGPRDVRDAIRRNPAMTVARYMPTDWQLNQFNRPKPTPIAPQGGEKPGTTP